MIKSSPATAKRRRQEQKVIREVRQTCVHRDGFCRLANKNVGPCLGVSEWCHFEHFKRFKTRRMTPEERHSTIGSFMACTRHHDMYDDHAIRVVAVTHQGCNGPLRIYSDQGVFEESERPAV